MFVLSPGLTEDANLFLLALDVVQFSSIVFQLRVRSLTGSKFVSVFWRYRSFGSSASHACFKNSPSLNGLPCIAILSLIQNFLLLLDEQMSWENLVSGFFLVCDLTSSCSFSVLGEFLSCLAS